MKKILVVTLFSLFLFSCSSNDSVSGTITSTSLNISTYSVEEINYTSAKIIGIVAYGDNLEIGFCWNTIGNPILNPNHKVVQNPGSGTFSYTLNQLSPNTTYYVRAYVKKSDGIPVYGNQLTFTTLHDLFINGTPVTVDGTSYNTLVINGKTWMKQNLNATTYSDGSPIQVATDVAELGSLKVGAYCDYAFDSANGPIYGKLYNWYAVAGIWNVASLTIPTSRKKLAPVGWHVSTDADWDSLATGLGGENVVGKKLKDNSATSTWDVSTNYGTNDSGFSALPGGLFYYHYELIPASPGPPPTLPIFLDKFVWKGKAAYWWTSSEVGTTAPDLVWVRDVNCTSDELVKSSAVKNRALSIRCVKD